MSAVELESFVQLPLQRGKSRGSLRGLRAGPVFSPRHFRPATIPASQILPLVMDLSRIIVMIAATALLAFSALLLVAIVLMLLVLANFLYVALCEAIAWTVTRLHALNAEHRLRP